MPKNIVYKDEIDKNFFLKTLKQKNCKIKDLGNAPEISCSERTLRRQLNTGKTAHLRPEYLDQIAKYLDVHPDYLSGKIYHKFCLCQDPQLKRVLLLQLHPENYPYFKKEQERHNYKDNQELLTHIFSLFDISYNQFEKLDFQNQYNLQYELFNEIIKIIKKYFHQDGYGREDMPTLYNILIDLEFYHDSYYEQQYADQILRKKYISSPPKGYTVHSISQMSSKQLLDLDYDLQIERKEL